MQCIEVIDPGSRTSSYSNHGSMIVLVFIELRLDEKTGGWNVLFTSYAIWWHKNPEVAKR